MQCRVGDDLYNFFTIYHPKLIQIMDYDPNSAVIGIPQQAPNGAILRENENALNLLERTKKFNIEWVKAGHVRGPNTNNVSATISVDVNNLYGANEVGEWEMTGQWMWDNRHNFNGLSVLPADNGSYKNAPFEVISDEEFDFLIKYIKNYPIDLTKIVEEEDMTTQVEELACSGGSCDLTY